MDQEQNISDKGRSPDHVPGFADGSGSRIEVPGDGVEMANCFRALAEEGSAVQNT